MPRSDRHVFAHSDADAAGSSVVSTPTTSRNATPTPVTPEQSSASEMTSEVSRQESAFIVTPRAWPGSSMSSALGHSGALRESDPLAALVSSFPVPPVAEEDVLVRLQQMLRPLDGQHLFSLYSSKLGPPPDRPLPPLPPARLNPEPRPDVEPAKLSTDTLDLALRYASPLQPTCVSGEGTSSFTVSCSISMVRVSRS